MEENNCLSSDLLEKYGFRKLTLKKWDKDKGYNPGYTHSIRIHEFQWLRYDHNGYMTLYQTHEHKKKIDTFVLPKPIRKEVDLILLLNAITPHL